MCLLALIVATWSAVSASVETYSIVPTESVFAVVTHKAGIASSLAHNHFVYPSEYTSEASVDPAHPELAHFKLQFPVTALVADDPDAKARWFPGIKDDGILDAPFPEVPEKDRQKIRESMLSAEQLDAQQFPDITAELKKISAKKTKVDAKEFEYEALVALTVHGKTVERPFAVNIEKSGDTAHVEGFATFKFSDFGIKPYSILLGAIRNQDEFQVFVDMKAKRNP